MRDCKHRWIKDKPESTGYIPNRWYCDKCGLARQKVNSTDAAKNDSYFYQPIIRNTSGSANK